MAKKKLYKIKKIVSYFFVLALLLYLVQIIASEYDTIFSIQWYLKPHQIVFVIFLSLLNYPLNVLFWHYLVRAFGGNPKLGESFHAWIMSNAARYIPGGVWQYPSRVVFMSKYNIAKNVASFAVLFEALIFMFVGAILVFTTLPFWNFPEEYARYQPLFYLFLCVPFLIVFFLSHKKVSDKLTVFLGKISHKNINPSIVAKINIKKIPSLLLLICVQFISNSSLIYMLSSSALKFDVSVFVDFVGIYSASWLLGFVTIFAPSGLGVFEVIAAFLLSLYMPLPFAVIVLLAFRLLLTLSEVFYIMLAIFLSRYNNITYGK